MVKVPGLDTRDDVPWKQRFRASRLLMSQLAKANPERGIVSSNTEGIFQLYAWDVASGNLIRRTDDPSGKAGGYLSPDGRFIYYFYDDKGDEIGHYVRVPYEGGEVQDVTPDLPLYTSFDDLAVSISGDVLGILAAHDNQFHLYRITLDNAGGLDVPRLIFTSDQFAAGIKLSCDGQTAVIASIEHSGKLACNLIAFDFTSGTKIAELVDVGADVQPVAFAPVAGDDRLLARTSQSGFERPVIWNPRTGERRDFPLNGLEGDVTPIDWSPDGGCILLLQVYQAQHQLFVYDLQADQLITLKDHPPGTFYPWGLYFDPASGDIFAQWESSTQTPCLVALDTQTGAIKRTLIAADDVQPASAWQSVSFPSSEGQMIQGWLALPEGEGPFPTILHTHGGPEWAMTDCYSPRDQLWTDHGFAFLTVNYRGSTTFGREFLEKIWCNPGNWELDDMVAGRDWLITQGIADPNAILLTGWSYGGYLSLHVLGKKPGLWAGSMAGVPVADWVSAHEDCSELMRASDVAFMGGTLAEKPEAYRAASPLTYLENVDAPVLIIQGRNDTRCPARQVELYEAKMKALGKPVEVHWFDAGHGSLDVELQIQHMETMLGFAYRVLG
jgi:dipeptidyl aminopeptidase/acylaminoacyl peptidase